MREIKKLLITAVCVPYAARVFDATDYNVTAITRAFQTPEYPYTDEQYSPKRVKSLCVFPLSRRAISARRLAIFRFTFQSA